MTIHPTPPRSPAARPPVARAAVVLALASLAAACARPHPASGPAPASPASSPAVAPADSFRQLLPELAKAHADKVQLSWYATSPLRRLDPPVKDFATRMGTQQKQLLEELRQWARARSADLTFHYPADPAGRARKLTDDACSKELQSASHTDFQRLMLLLMYVDYQDAVGRIKTLQSASPDPQLRTYLDHSLQTHLDGLAEIRNLLARCKFQ